MLPFDRIADVINDIDGDWTQIRDGFLAPETIKFLLLLCGRLHTTLIRFPSSLPVLNRDWEREREKKVDDDYGEWRCIHSAEKFAGSELRHRHHSSRRRFFIYIRTGGRTNGSGKSSATEFDLLNESFHCLCRRIAQFSTWSEPWLTTQSSTTAAAADLYLWRTYMCT